MILAVDSGTTTTRVSVVDAGAVIASTSERSGARDFARSQGLDQLPPRLRRLADEALGRCDRSWASVEAVVAFGMITSELGLEEVPHLTAPIDQSRLVAGIQARTYPDSIPVTVYLVPGVRCSSPSDGETSDFMRGEETEVMGLLVSEPVSLPALYVSTGSHTKFIAIDDQARIEWSLTTLSGELVWALHRETILAELIDPAGTIVDTAALLEGADCAERLGLSRALFMARLLNRTRGMDPASCSDFIHGAIASSDMHALRRARRDRQAQPVQVVIAGTGGPLAAAYRHFLEAEPWVQGLLRTESPIGALGAFALYGELVRSEAPRRDGPAGTNSTKEVSNAIE